jgi:type III secretion protein O
MDVIDGLLRIKRAREEIREAEMTGAKHRLEHAAELLRNAIAVQQQRDEERSERERSLYDDVCSRVVVVRDLNELNSEVDQMKDEAKADEEAVQDAQKQRTARRHALDEATHVWRAAALATQRFADLARNEMEEKARETERLAELELEEYPGIDAFARAMQEEA